LHNGTKKSLLVFQDICGKLRKNEEIIFLILGANLSMAKRCCRSFDPTGALILRAFDFRQGLGEHLGQPRT